MVGVDFLLGTDFNIHWLEPELLQRKQDEKQTNCAQLWFILLYSFSFLPENHLSLRLLCVLPLSDFIQDLVKIMELCNNFDETESLDIISSFSPVWVGIFKVRSGCLLPCLVQVWLSPRVDIPGSLHILLKCLTPLTVKPIWNVTHVPLCIYKSEMFPNVNIQHLVVNLDGEVVWSLGKR